ncbi:MAG: T9SS type A sorting domain-containing protein [Bacteroidales bacterium]|jgi:hypothetical protein|nr:T9SS type A sorting domain-containing protein [Bacteroidales bacterium]
MKKILVLFFASLAFFGYSQSFQISDKDGNPYSNDHIISAVITEDDLDFGEYKIFLNVRNLTSETLRMNILPKALALNENLKAYVCCFGSCYDDLSEISGQIEANEIDEFSLHLVPDTCLCYFGLAQLTLEFWSDAEQADKVKIYVNIEMKPLGLKDTNLADYQITVFPNPVSSQSTLHVSYSLPEHNNNHQLVFRNILGKLIFSTPLHSFENNIQIDVTAFSSGVYFYSIENSKQILATRKLIVK